MSALYLAVAPEPPSRPATQYAKLYALVEASAEVDGSLSAASVSRLKSLLTDLHLIESDAVYRLDAELAGP